MIFCPESQHAKVALGPALVYPFPLKGTPSKRVSGRTVLRDQDNRVRDAILVLNGPNLNLLGTREPEIYGHASLEDVRATTLARATHHGLTADFRQSNDEGELVTWIQEAREGVRGIIINAAAYTHTSVAILDALQAYGKPVIEVHLSNIFKREDFRHHSYVSKVATGVICGFGPQGYALAVDAMAELLTKVKT